MGCMLCAWARHALRWHHSGQCIDPPTSTSIMSHITYMPLVRQTQVVIKSQILAGGRGLGKFTNGLQGGVHIVKASQAVELAKKMLNATLVTKQTGPAGGCADSAQCSAMAMGLAPVCVQQMQTRYSWSRCDATSAHHTALPCQSLGCYRQPVTITLMPAPPCLYCRQASQHAVRRKEDEAGA